MRLQRHSNGERISVSESDIVGTGGEAKVYIVSPGRNFAAKVYHNPTETRRLKLAAMLANPPDNAGDDRAHTSIAWPLDLLSTAYGERGFAGYLMPGVTGMRPLFHVYNPSMRRNELDQVDTLFLHRSARNLAAAVKSLHAKGYVIGDVNESNVLVSKTALVTLVDTDSFQVRDPVAGRLFRCTVGKAEYTPPEMQGRRFAGTDRTFAHDRFGLAVLLFQLLMEGTHPFSGLYCGSGDPPTYESRIASGSFAYGDQTGAFRPSPSAPPLSDLDPRLRTLFLRCFENGHSHPEARPDAAEWQDALSGSELALVRCPENPLHSYSSHLTSCPLCKRKESLGGRDPFPGRNVRNERPMRRVRAASMLPAISIGHAPALPLAGGGIPHHVNTPTAAAALQSSVAISASNLIGPLPSLPTPTLFHLRMDGTGWAWGAVFWALLSIGSASFGLTGLNWLTVVFTFACGIKGWMSNSGLARLGRVLSSLSVVGGCLSLFIRPITSSSVGGAVTLSGTSGAVRALSFSHAGSRLAAGTGRREDGSLGTGEIEIWDVDARRLAVTVDRVTGDVSSVAFAPDGQGVVAATNTPFGAGEVILVDPSVSGSYRSVSKERRRVQQVAWSPDGRLIACAGEEHVVKVLSADRLQTMLTLEVPSGASSIAFSADCRYLAVGCASPQGSITSGFVSVWDLTSGRRKWLQSAHGNGVLSVAFAPTGSVLASSGNDGAICLWDSNSGQLRRRQTAHSAGIAAIAFSPDGSEIATAEERIVEGDVSHEIVLRNASTCAPLRSLSGSSDSVTSLAYSPKGGLLASGSRDGKIWLWHVSSR